MSTTTHTFESLLDAMSNLASIPLDAREQFDSMLREHFEGLINDDAGDEAEASFEVGDRVYLEGYADRLGTVKRVEDEDIRVVWDSAVVPGVLATWAAAARLVKVVGA